MAGTTGLEPATSAVTGQRSNQLSYVPGLSKAFFSAPEKKRVLGISCFVLLYFITICYFDLGPSRTPDTTQ
jgi:hypothetical protein